MTRDYYVVMDERLVFPSVDYAARFLNKKGGDVDLITVAAIKCEKVFGHTWRRLCKSDQIKPEANSIYTLQPRKTP